MVAAEVHQQHRRPVLGRQLLEKVIIAPHKSSQHVFTIRTILIIIEIISLIIIVTNYLFYFIIINNTTFITVAVMAFV